MSTSKFVTRSVKLRSKHNDRENMYITGGATEDRASVYRQAEPLRYEPQINPTLYRPSQKNVPTRFEPPFDGILPAFPEVYRDGANEQPGS